MTRTLTRTLGLLLALAMVVLAAACGGTQPTPTSGTTPTGGTTPTVEATPTEEPGKPMKTTELGSEIPDVDLGDDTVVKWIGIRQPQFLSNGTGVVYEFFKKYYGGTIEMDVTAPGEVYTKLASLVLSGEAPDIVPSMGGGFPNLAILDIIAPVDGLIDFEDELFANYKDTYDQFEFDGSRYWIPWVADNLSFTYYNTKIFEDNGLETPKELFEQGLWDWDAFTEYAQELYIDENSDGVPERWGAAMCIWHDARMVLTTSESIVKVDGANILSNLGSPNVERAYNFLVDLTQKLKVVDPNDDPNNVIELLNTGKAAMMTGPDFWSGDNNVMLDIKKAKQLEWAPYPKDPQADKHYVPGETIGFYVPKGVTIGPKMQAFVYSCMAAMKEAGIKGGEAYQKGIDEFMEVWGEYYTVEEYEAIGEYNKVINSLPLIPEPFQGMMDLDVILSAMQGVGGAAPLTYQQAVAQLEPTLNAAIEAVLNPQTAE